jgi:serine/threonine protein kinase
MLCYRLPFEAESTQLLYKKIRQGLPSLPSHVLPAARSLLHGMLEVAPEKRCARLTTASHPAGPARSRQRRRAYTPQRGGLALRAG